MKQGRPVIIHGDGQALWTFTHARDFATLFVPLFGHQKALGEAYHIMTDTAFTWEFLFQATARALGVEPQLTFVPTQTLIRYNPAWTGPLLGDKAWSSLFDISKIQSISGVINQPVPLDEGFNRVMLKFEERMKSFSPDPELHALIDLIAREQDSLGTE
jgi:nucleoside-diphosphate-sugar epimerase